jgi:hypothetical protein
MIHDGGMFMKSTVSQGVMKSEPWRIAIRKRCLLRAERKLAGNETGF